MRWPNRHSPPPWHLTKFEPAPLEFMSDQFYPQSDEVDFSEDSCPNCGHSCFSATFDSHVETVKKKQEAALENEIKFLSNFAPELGPERLRSIVTVAFYAGAKVMLHNL